MNDAATTFETELDAMKQVAAALEPLDDAATNRVLRWAVGRYGDSDITPVEADQDTNTDADSGVEQFAELADLHAHISPDSEATRALVGAYWIQCVQENENFTAHQVNTQLKHLGHPSSNITGALGALMAQRPQLVTQLRKSGTSRQARKTYKVTAAGAAAVDDMIRKNGH